MCYFVSVWWNYSSGQSLCKRREIEKEKRIFRLKTIILDGFFGESSRYVDVCMQRRQIEVGHFLQQRWIQQRFPLYIRRFCIQKTISKLTVQRFQTFVLFTLNKKRLPISICFHLSSPAQHGTALTWIHFVWSNPMCCMSLVNLHRLFVTNLVVSTDFWMLIFGFFSLFTPNDGTFQKPDQKSNQTKETKMVEKFESSQKRKPKH